MAFKKTIFDLRITALVIPAVLAGAQPAFGPLAPGGYTADASLRVAPGEVINLFARGARFVLGLREGRFWQTGSHQAGWLLGYAPVQAVSQATATADPACLAVAGVLRCPSQRLREVRRRHHPVAFRHGV